MTNLQKKRLRVDKYLRMAQQQKNDIDIKMQSLVRATSRAIQLKHLWREAVFELYVSSSHRQFMRFLADMGET